MIDIVLLLAIVVVYVFGIATGVSIQRNIIKNTTTKAIENPSICGCSHHKSYHKDGGHCHHQTRLTYTIVNCGCMQFISMYPEDPFLEAARKELEKGA